MIAAWKPIDIIPKDGTSIIRYHVIWKCIISVYYKKGVSLTPNCNWITSDYSNSYPEEAFAPMWDYPPKINIDIKPKINE